LPIKKEKRTAILLYLIQRKKPVSREIFVNDIKQGVTKYFYPSGKTKQTLPYINGKQMA